MGRLRATLARSSLDREIAQRLDEAERALSSALRFCESQKVPPGVETLRRRRVLRDLERALQAVSSVGSVSPRFDMNDPDLNNAPPALPPKKAESPSGES